LLAHLVSNAAPFEVEKLHFDSAALRTLIEADVCVAVPLVSQGGMLRAAKRD
jgi:hypothetical protein